MDTVVVVGYPIPSGAYGGVMGTDDPDSYYYQNPETVVENQWPAEDDKETDCSGDQSHFFGGGWAALVAGVSATGGGGDGHGSAGTGLGMGYFFGWSADPSTASENAAIDSLTGGLGPFGTNWYFDWNPFTIGGGVHGGGYAPVTETVRPHSCE